MDEAITMDLFFSGLATDLCNFASDLGTERDRGQLDRSPYGGVPYGRDVVRLMDLRLPASAIRLNIEQSPALEGLGAEVTVDGTVGQVRALDVTLTFDTGKLDASFT